MRVLQLGPFPPPHGGIQTNLVAIREYLRSRGIPCGVINLTRHRKANSDEVYYPDSAAELLRLLLTLPYDTLHLHIGGNLTPRLLALSLTCCLIPGKKAVLSSHSGGFPSSPEGRAMHARTLPAFVLRRFDAVIGINTAIVAWLATLGIAPGRLHYILPYADVLEPAPGLSSLLAAFYRKHDPVLLTVGLLEPEYDLLLQIDTLGKIRERLHDAGLVIIGAGSLEADLRRAIVAVPWAEHILLAGDVPHPVTLKATAEAAILLRTTLYDGDSVSVREALRLGTPVIATDNGMRPANVRLIPVKDAAALEQAILEQTQQAALRQGRTQPEAAPPSNANLEAVLEVYKRLWDAS
jgi:glycosyltransferase involved in cell wall biosynthesis